MDALTELSSTGLFKQLLSIEVFSDSEMSKDSEERDNKFLLAGIFFFKKSPRVQIPAFTTILD